VQIDHLKERIEILQRLRLMSVSDFLPKLPFCEKTYRSLLEREFIRESDVAGFCTAFNCSKAWFYADIAEVREYKKLSFPYWLEEIKFPTPEEINGS